MDIYCPKCGVSVGDNHNFCQSCGFKMQGVLGPVSPDGKTENTESPNPSKGKSTPALKKTTLVTAIVVASICVLAGIVIGINLKTGDTPTNDNEGDDLYVPRFNEWRMYSFGDFSTDITSSQTTVSCAYDGSDTVPDTGGWNGFWLVSESSYSEDFRCSVEIDVNQATGIEWAATIGLVLPGSDFPPHEACNWGMYYYHGVENSIGTWFTDYQGETGLTVLDTMDITLGSPTEYCIEGSDGLVRLYINGQLSGTREFPTDDVRFCINSSVKYSGTEMSVTFRLVNE